MASVSLSQLRVAYYQQARYLEAIADYSQMIQLKPFDYRAA
ncbi:MAG TPA: hypothetical protein V6D43_04555 [Candidatus Sericytochromatia bacterium]